MPSEQETKYSVHSPEQSMHQHLHPHADWAASFKQRELPELSYAPLFPRKTSTLELFPLFSF